MLKVKSQENVNNLMMQVTLIAACFISFLLSQSLSAQSLPPGSLDPTFGNGGRVSTPYGWASSIAIQSDGKIVTAGSRFSGNAGNLFTIVRYNRNGTLDTSFGVVGIVTTTFGDFDCVATSVAIQSDGKIVAAGYSGSGSAYNFAIARYNPDGSLDASFDGDGKVTTTIGGNDLAYSVSIQSDGKIVVAGQGGEYPNGYGGIVRYNTDGTLDTSFDGDGKVTTPTSFGHSGASSVAVQTDNKIVTAGNGLYGSIAVVRYNTNGSLDTSFSQNGQALVYIDIGTLPGEEGASTVAIQSDGKIVVAGFASDFDGFYNVAVLARFNSDGSLDGAFGNAGTVITETGQYSWASALAVQTNGKIVAVGSGNIYDFLVMRYNANGSLDTSYGNGGKVIVDFGGQSGAQGVALDSFGRAVVAGYGGLPGSIAVARLLGNNAVPPPARFDFDGNGRSDISVFRPSDSVWYLNRSTEGFSATQFGIPTDKLTPADYDGDGKTDIAVFRDGVWWRINSTNNTVFVDQFGLAGDIPVPADYTGDGRDEIAVYRNGEWWSMDLTNQQAAMTRFGLATDKPVAADYDGDGKADQAVYRNGEWHLNRSSNGYTVEFFGLATDHPVPADYDGDGETDLAVYRDGTWYIQQSTQGFTAFQFGLSTDTPVPADYDGDGKTDAAVYRDGIWYVLKSTGGISIQQFGLPNDKPIPAAFLP